jgi:hypothetical protein
MYWELSGFDFRFSLNLDEVEHKEHIVLTSRRRRGSVKMTERRADEVSVFF